MTTSYWDRTIFGVWYLQYYYNGNTGQFLYWDGERQTYLPAPTGDGTNAGTSGEKKEDEEKISKKEREKKEKVKIAKKIAKVGTRKGNGIMFIMFWWYIARLWHL